MKEELARIEFHNAIVDCRKQTDYLLDIYREVTVAFEKKETDPERGKGIEVALKQAMRAGIITEREYKNMREDWQVIPNSDDLGDLQENMEKAIFNMPFNCALKAVQNFILE